MLESLKTVELNKDYALVTIFSNFVLKKLESKLENFHFKDTEKLLFSLDFIITIACYMTKVGV